MSHGRHRKPRRQQEIKKIKTSKNVSPRKEMMFSTLELVIMILLGTLGVLMVLAARPFAHRSGS